MVNQLKTELYHDHLDELIRETGWGVQGVGENEDGFNYAYTVGLAQRALPEIIAIGTMKVQTLMLMVNRLADLWVHKPELVGTGMVDLGMVLAEGEPVRAKVRELTDIDKVRDERARQIVYRYGNDCEILQLVFADDRNVLPDEPNYSPVLPQPLL